ncbi:sigma-70 family RNA polymerase sigma factor [Catenovulum agarivorans]|uniref:sigma-70 family RNA polymerase sigma factor n=1 Tax=Catenovulum agarivorans TaxID=1172192 RepID=UPI000302F341|nr:sigma-70 family RNA polymerase sigma factor [Catenovulum agarivorans]
MPEDRPSTPRTNTDLASAKLFNSEAFAELFEADKDRLYTYIYAFVNNSAAADDIFQETCLALWKDFHKFEQGTNFTKWANGIGFNRVLSFRRQHKKYTLGLSDDFLVDFEKTLADSEANIVVQEAKLGYLEHCRALLSDPMKKIFNSFYIESKTAQEVADDTGRSVFAIRKAVHKMRQKIFDCVDEKEQEGDS